MTDPPIEKPNIRLPIMRSRDTEDLIGTFLGHVRAPGVKPNCPNLPWVGTGTFSIGGGITDATLLRLKAIYYHIFRPK